MNIKFLTALSWSIASSIFLWMINLAQVSSFSKPPPAIELFGSWSIFFYLLIGGGFSYHLFTEILVSPYDNNNNLLWKRLFVKMFILMLIFVSIPIFILILRELAPRTIAYFISLCYFTFAALLAGFFLNAIKPIFLEIRKIKS